MARHWRAENRKEPLPEPDPDHVELLRQGSAAWNSWRAESPDVIPRLFGADLTDVDISGCDLRGAQLDGADLSGATMRRVRLDNASLCEAVLWRANLDKCEGSSIDFTDADLLQITASDAVLSQLEAKGARLAGAVIHRSQLSGSNLHGVDLREAELVGSDLRRVNFEDAILWTTDLTEADLRNAKGMRLDETIIRNTKFSPRSPDRWSTLRRHYTGPRYALTLLLLLAFVLPYFAKAAGWVAAARVQETVAEAVSDAIVRIESLPNSEAGTAVSQLLNGVEESLPSPAAAEWRPARVWELLLGVDRGAWYFLSTLALLVYNLLRGLLTFIVGPMRDAEERSGVAPPHRVEGPGRTTKFINWFKGGWAESYAWLWLPHRAVSFLFVVAAGTFAFHAISWLTLPVWLPR